MELDKLAKAEKKILEQIKKEKKDIMSGKAPTSRLASTVEQKPQVLFDLEESKSDPKDIENSSSSEFSPRFSEE